MLQLIRESRATSSCLPISERRERKRRRKKTLPTYPEEKAMKLVFSSLLFYIFTSEKAHY